MVDTTLCSHYTIKCWTWKYGGQWVVFRNRDNHVMTQGSVFHCCRWVQVWGAMRLHGK